MNIDKPQSRVLYVSDLDGTLLRPDATLSAFAKGELNRLISRGLNFTVATARSIWTVQNILAGLNLQLPVIEMNGAILSDFQTSTHSHMWSIDSRVADRIYSCLRVHDFHPFVATCDNSTDRLYYCELPNAASEWYVEEKRIRRDPRLTFCEDLSTIYKGRIVNFVIFDREERVRSIQSVLNHNDFPNLNTSICEHVYCPGWWELNVQHADATKPNAIRHLMRRFGFDAASLTVFGDHANDLGMFASADRRIAPINAIPEILEMATEIVESNAEDGVVKFLVRDFPVR